MSTAMTVEPTTERKSGRSPGGRLRNFKAMYDGKLLGVLADVEREDDDPRGPQRDPRGGSPARTLMRT